MLNFVKLLNLNQILFISWIINLFLIGKFITPINVHNLLNIKYLIDIRGNLVILNILVNALILIFLTIYRKKKTPANVLAILFLIFSLAQSISYNYYLEEIYKRTNFNPIFILTHIFFIISPSLIIINILLINNSKLFQNIIKFSIGSIGFIIFFVIIRVEILRPQMSFQVINFESININYNGFSRLILLVYFFILIIFIEKKLNFLNKIILLVTVISINYFLITIQSRTAIILCVTGSTIAIFLERNRKLYKKLLNLILIFAIPLLIYSFKYNIKKNRIYNLQGERLNLTEQNSQTKDNTLKDNTLDAISTGRINKWIFITKELYNNKSYILFGRGGPQIDRLIFAENFHNYQINTKNYQSSEIKNFLMIKDYQGQDVANGALYSILSAGILGLFIYLFIIFLIIFLLYKILVNIDKNYSYFKSKDIYFKYSSLVAIILILRSFLENGFMVWGVDQLFFILCASYVCNYYYSFK
jgi:hypothetical protein